MSRLRKPLRPYMPLRHPDRARPRMRRDFIEQEFGMGMGVVLSAPIFGTMANSAFARDCNTQSAPSCLSVDIEALRDSCGIANMGAGKIPFICFDPAGGANISGSNMLVGGRDGQMNFLSTAGYNKMGLPGDMTPGAINTGIGTNNFINTGLGLAFHSDSAFLRGILEKCSAETLAGVNSGAIPALRQRYR